MLAKIKENPSQNMVDNLREESRLLVAVNPRW